MDKKLLLHSVAYIVMMGSPLFATEAPQLIRISKEAHAAHAKIEEKLIHAKEKTTEAHKAERDAIRALEKAGSAATEALQLLETDFKNPTVEKMLKRAKDRTAAARKAERDAVRALEKAGSATAETLHLLEYEYKNPTDERLTTVASRKIKETTVKAPNATGDAMEHAGKKIKETVS